MDKIPDRYDVIIVGTGLIESIVAGAVSRSGKSVLHVDPNAFYGLNESSLDLVKALDLFSGVRDATTNTLFQECYGDISIEVEPLALNEDDPYEFLDYLAKVPKAADTIARVLGIEKTNLAKILLDKDHPEVEIPLQKLEQVSRLCNLVRSRADYGIETSPRAFLYAGGIIELLVSSKVGRFLTFSPLDGLYTHYRGNTQKVLFCSETFTLMEKRLIMKAVKSIIPDQKDLSKLKDECFIDYIQSKGLSRDLSYFFASILSISYDDYTSLPSKTGVEELFKLITSAEHTSDSAFLLGHYGGSSEIVQAFCRYSAVHGATYILSENIESIDTSGPNRIVMSNGTTFHCDKIIVSTTYINLIKDFTQAEHERHVLS